MPLQGTGKKAELKSEYTSKFGKGRVKKRYWLVHVRANEKEYPVKMYLTAGRGEIQHVAAGAFINMRTGEILVEGG
jgi:hypothetical protein